MPLGKWLARSRFAIDLRAVAFNSMHIAAHCRCRARVAVGILPVCQTAIRFIRATSDYHFNHWLDGQVLSEVAVVTYRHDQRVNRALIRQQAEGCDGLGGQDMSLPPGSPLGGIAKTREECRSLA